MIRRTLAVALFCAVFASTHARADQDAVQFFSNIHVAEGSEVHDAVCFFCSVEAEGKVTGDVVVFFGNVHIASAAEHDVVSFFGRVTADDNATIDHDVVSIFGNVRLGDNVHVGEDLVAMFGSLRTGQGVTVEGDRVVQPAMLFYGPFFFLVLVFILVIREFRSWRRRQFLRGYGYPPQPK
jgi:hypothetical protein